MSGYVLNLYGRSVAITSLSETIGDVKFLRRVITIDDKFYELREGFTAQPIPYEIRQNMLGRTFRENLDISLDELSYLKVRYCDFTHSIGEGELIVHRSLAKEVLEIFEELFEAEYEIEKIRLCDCYDGDDERCMADNNSSAFNYRNIDGTQTLSLHALGRAIDINPLYNPYIVGEKISPANSVPYCDREQKFAHKIDHDDLCFNVFVSHGWLWGGDWETDKDYQHFYKPKQTPVGQAVKKLKELIKK